MGRIASGKERIDIINRSQKNGTIYVYERVSIYDKSKGYYVTKEEKLLGKKVDGYDEIIPTRSKRKKEDMISNSKVEATRKKIGASLIIEQIGKSSGIDEDIYNSCDEITANKIITLARYYLQSDGEPTSHIEKWQSTHSMEPYGSPISENIAHNLFKEIGSNESISQNIFLNRAERINGEKVLAYDSTTVSTYGKNHTRSRYGYNKDSDGLETDKTFTFYSMNDRQPICFNTIPGNIPDVVAIENALKQLQVLGIKNAEVVSDCGFYSEKNLSLLFQSSFNFITRAPHSVKWIRSEIDKVLTQIEDTGNMCLFESGTYGTTICLRHKIKKQRKYASKEKGLESGDNEYLSKRIYLHVFVNDVTKISNSCSFDNELNRIRNEYLGGQREFTESAKKIIDKYMIIKNKKDGTVDIKFNTAAIKETKKYDGVFVLISNKEKDTFEALRKYRKREWIEDFFEEYKQRIGNKKYRVWDDLTMDGKKLVQFVSLCYYEHFSKEIRKLKATLGTENGDAKHDLKENLKKEKQLKTWLDNNFIHEIFEWFDAMEKIDICSPYYKKIWTTEVIERDKLFLSKLGIDLKNNS